MSVVRQRVSTSNIHYNIHVINKRTFVIGQKRALKQDLPCGKSAGIIRTFLSAKFFFFV